jgi:hypothetical protein
MLPKINALTTAPITIMTEAIIVYRVFRGANSFPVIVKIA